MALEEISGGSSSSDSSRTQSSASTVSGVLSVDESVENTRYRAAVQQAQHASLKADQAAARLRRAEASGDSGQVHEARMDYIEALQTQIDAQTEATAGLARIRQLQQKAAEQSTASQYTVQDLVEIG